MCAKSIEKLRSQFETELTTQVDLYHPIDIERVRTEEWQVKRFLEHHSGDEPKAFEALCKALQFKKSYGIHDRNDQYFPREFWEVSGAEMCGRDKNGRVVLWGAIRNLRHYKETKEITTQFVVHTLERADRAGGEEGFVVVIDNNGGKISNINMELSRFCLSILDYYPLCMRSMYSVDLPWLLNSLMKLIISLMSSRLQEIIHFVNSEELAEILDPAHIPVTLKGNREKRVFPSDLVSLRECHQMYGLTDKFVDRFCKDIKVPVEE